jgi:hypothetical protein
MEKWYPLVLYISGFVLFCRFTKNAELIGSMQYTEGVDAYMHKATVKKYFM